MTDDAECGPAASRRVEFAEGRTSREALTLLQRGPGFGVLAATRREPQPAAVPGAPAAEQERAIGPEHRARELLNRLTLMALCLQLPDVTDAEWLRWPWEVAAATRQLDALYAGGLSRDFRNESPGDARERR